MSDKQQNSGQSPTDPATLRKQAEEQARTMEPISLSTQTPEEIQRMLHELRVHQIELEMQNEQLRTAQAQIEAERARYFDLYDQAPVGYCTLSEKGLILETNLTAATLLGTTRSELVTQPLSRFIHNEDQDIYYLYRKKLFDTGQAQECDLRLVKPDGTLLWAYLTATAAQAEDVAPLCRVVISDITERKRMEEALKKRIVALTQPLDNPEGIGFEELFNNNELQRLQDEFTRATGVASIITHPNGVPITEPSNFCRLCIDIIRKTEIGSANCLKSDALLGRPNSAGPTVMPCLSGGLLDAGAAIYVGDRHIANWLIGQVRDEEQAENKIRTYARAIGADEEAAVKAFWEVPTMSRQQFEQVASMLFTLANQISKLAWQNIQHSRFLTDRKRAEEVLAQAVEERSILLDTIQTQVWYLIDDHTYGAVNKAHAEFIGQKIEDLAFKNLYDIFAKDIVDVSRHSNVEVFTTGRPVRTEEWAPHVSGERRLISILKSPKLRADGTVEYVVCSAEDITQQKHAEEENRRFRTIADNAVYGKAIADLQGHLLYINRFFANIHGYSPEELTGRHFSLFHSQEQMVTANRLIATMIQEGHFAPTIVWHRHQDGTEFPLLMSGILIKDDHGIPQYIATSAIDVSAQYQAEAKLAESEETYRALIDGLPDTVMRFDREGRHLFVSDNVREVVDIEAAQFIGKTHTEMGFTENLCHFWKESIQQVFDSGAPFETEFTFEGKAGTTTSNWRLIPERDAQGAVSSVLSISRDITAQRQAEQEYQTLFREMLDGFALHEIVCDAEGEPVDYRFLAVNPAFERMTGLTAEAIIGRPVLEVLPRTEKHWIEIFGKVALSGEPVSFENHAAELGKYFEVRAFRPFVGRFVCIFQDITEHKKADKALRESEKLLSRTQEIAHTGSWKLDLTTQRLTWSDEVYRIFGYEPQEFPATYEAFLNAIHPDDRAEVNEAYSRSLREASEGYKIEHRIVRLNSGEIRYVYEQCVHERDDAGTIIQSIGMVQDITERKREEEEKDKLQEQLIQAQMIAHLGSWVFNTDENRLVWSEETYRIFGILPQDFNGSEEAFQATIHPEDRDAVVAAYARSLEDADFTYDIEHRILRKDTGEARHVHERCTHQRNTDGTVARSYGTVQDITERKRSEEERKKLQAQLIQAQKMESIGLLAGGVAHDFNNMLGVILGYSEMTLEQVPAGHPMYKALHGIQQAAQRSADLTRQLLTFARKQTIAPKRIDLDETVEGMLKMLRRLIGEDIDLIWLPGRNLHPVKMDPTQIDQILANLCVNARDAINGVGRVTIETSNTVFDAEYCAQHAGFVPGEYVLLAVSDNGRGMDRETISHLFEPFFTTKEQGQGTGLGLASVYGAVTQNKGFINVYSEPGQGTTFKIYLRAYVEKSAGVVGKAPEIPAEHGKETILLVEDESTILEMTTMMLERLGYTVVAAATPGEAIRLAHEHSGSIDLLMTDVVMPEMNGRELARKLLTHYPDLKRLFMSGYTANVIAHHGVLDERVHFIQKPFTMKDLGAKLRAALDRE